MLDGLDQSVKHGSMEPRNPVPGAVPVSDQTHAGHSLDLAHRPSSASLSPFLFPFPIACRPDEGHRASPQAGSVPCMLFSSSLGIADPVAAPAGLGPALVRCKLWNNQIAPHMVPTENCHILHLLHPVQDPWCTQCSQASHAAQVLVRLNQVLHAVQSWSSQSGHHIGAF